MTLAQILWCESLWSRKPWSSRRVAKHEVWLARCRRVSWWFRRRSPVYCGHRELRSSNDAMWDSWCRRGVWRREQDRSCQCGGCRTDLWCRRCWGSHRRMAARRGARRRRNHGNENQRTRLTTDTILQLLLHRNTNWRTKLRGKNSEWKERILQLLNCSTLQLVLYTTKGKVTANYITTNFLTKPN